MHQTCIFFGKINQKIKNKTVCFLYLPTYSPFLVLLFLPSDVSFHLLLLSSAHNPCSTGLWLSAEGVITGCCKLESLQVKAIYRQILASTGSLPSKVEAFLFTFFLLSITLQCFKHFFSIFCAHF